MLIPNLDIINSCLICRNNNNNDNYEYLYVEYQRGDTTITELSEVGSLYEELIGLKICLESYDFYPKFLCNNCIGQMKLFNKLKTTAVQSWEFFAKEIYNINKVEEEEDPIQYEQMEFIHESSDNNTKASTQLEDCMLCIEIDDNAEKTLKMKEAEVESVATIPNVIPDNDKDSLECTQVIHKSDYITEIYELLDNGKDQSANNDYLIHDLPNENPATNHLEENFSTSNYDALSTERVIRKSKNPREDLKCELCQIEFESVKDMKAHGDFVHNGKYPCGQCLKLFNSLKALRIHTNLHKGLLPYRCELCPRAFNQKVHYQTHLRQHKNERNFQCSECDKAFFTKADLKVHERIHTGYRPHVCEECGKDFILLVHLKMHMYSHTGKKKFSCEYCKQWFVSPNTLRLHKQTIHLRERQFKCEYCTKPFRRKHHLINHMKKIHEKFINNAEEISELSQGSEFLNNSEETFAGFVLIPNDEFLISQNDREDEQFTEITNNSLKAS